MSAARLLCRSILAPEQRVDKDAQSRPPQRGRWHPHSGVRRRGRRRSLGRLWQGNPLEYLPDKNMSLRRRQVVRNEASVNAQTEHRPGVAGRFELNCDLSDHRPLPAEIRYRIADHPHLVYAPLAAEAFGEQAPEPVNCAGGVKRRMSALRFAPESRARLHPL
jgi:hypothetical protein